MLDKNILKETIEFSIKEKSNTSLIPIEYWEKTDGINYLETLKGLTENGYGVEEKEKFIIPINDLYYLDPIEFELLDFPPFYPFDIYIQSKGVITSPRFKYTYSFCSFAPNGENFKAKREGLFININGQDYILNKEQYNIIESIDEFNLLDFESKTSNNNLIEFSEIKELSKSASITLEKILSKKDVIQPQHIKVDLNYDNDSLEVIPTIDGDLGEKFANKFDRLDQVPDNYSIFRENNRKTHVVLNPVQKEELTNIKENLRKVTDKKKIEEIIKSPEKFFNKSASNEEKEKETIDISEFYSDRVIEIGLYQPKVYPFISPYKSQWIPGARIEDRTNGTTNIVFKDEDELQEFKQEIENAKQSEEDKLTYKGANIPLTSAQEILETAEEKLKEKKPVTAEGANSIKETEKQQEVLIIEENTEKLGFTTDINQDSKKDLVLHRDLSLKSEIKLKEHQEKGIAWLQNLAMEDKKGCLLADDMGLGKTLQILYLVDWHSRTYPNNDKPYLIVAPISLLENWEQEYDKFFCDPKLEVERLYKIPKQLDRGFINCYSRKQILLTNYESVRNGQLNFCAIDFAMVILDEAQKIKTPGTLVTNAAKALKSDFKIAMTGTPIENTFVDLWCITDFSVPGLLGNAKTFAKKYQNPLKNKETDINALGTEIRNSIDYYFLRRLKSDVAKDLPNKQIITIEKEMPSEQLERYNMVINSVANNKDKKGTTVLSDISKIRTISDHPYLLDSVIDNYSVDEIINSSAKLLATLEILNLIKGKREKAIIFTERKDMQRTLQRIIKSKFSISSSIINGDTATIKKRNKLTRQETIDKFEDKVGFNVIIMSPVAAGMGLNVVGANHVIHYSRHWNPAKEEQATDRAYRIGQEKEVYVYYPMAISKEFKSFDVILKDLLERKKQLALSTLYPTEMMEVNRQELFDSIFSTKSEFTEKRLSLKDIDNLNPYLFETFSAVLFKEKGFDIKLTPKSGDKGIDVLAFSPKQNYCIQCKQSKNNIGRECIQEVTCGKKYYEHKYDCEFTPLVFTNSRLTKEATELAEIHHVILYATDEINSFIESNSINRSDLNSIEKERMLKL